MAKKVVLFPEIVRVIKIYFFCFKQKKNAQEKHAKETKENRKTKKKKKKKKRLEKMVLMLLTVFVENLTGYDDIVCEFVLCTFNLRDQRTKRERVLNIIWKTFVYICLRYVEDRNQSKLI